jgi:4-hydroxyphenylacetate 3-monooxygenase
MTPSAAQQRLSLRPAGGEELDVVVRSVVIAGFTGRDRAEVERHIAELEAIGVARPPLVPAFYDVPAALLTTAGEIEVPSAETSAEVEPVLFCTAAGAFVGVGSDHTDRDVERHDIAQSKRACPKVVGRDVVPYETAAAAWDEIALTCRTADGAVYQSGRAGALLPIPDVLRLLDERNGGLPREGLVVFLGTLPLRTDGFVFSERYALEMALPGAGPRLQCDYSVSIAREATT